ncbi:MAG TPA: hypothetical protein VFE37_19280 [Chloroflexota bacterium]|nr:hypothetical protein [Chloroflexota bacterium]
MPDTPRPVEINGLVFASTSEGHLLESEVREHVEALQREIAELRTRLEHLGSLERLAQATVVKADELAAEIEAEARRRADEIVQACEAEVGERRRRFEAETNAQQAAAQARVAQLQAALEGTLQTLGRALQAAGAPALEMPAASGPVAPSAAALDAAGPRLDTNGRAEPAGSAVAAEDASDTRFGRAAVEGLPAAGEREDASARAWGRGSERPADIAEGGGEAAPAGGAGAAEHGVGDEWRREAPAAEARGAAAAQAEHAEGEDSGAAAGRGDTGSGTFELARRGRQATEPTPIRPLVAERATDESGATTPAETGPTALSRVGPATLEIDMRPVKSFADLARVTKLLGRIAPGAQPLDLNLPQHRALFSVQGKDAQALAAELQEALPDAKVVEREEGLDVLLEGDG